MDEATVVFSRKGLFQVRVKARDIRSREHARKLWPLVSPDNRKEMVTWVSPIFADSELRRRSYFRRMPSAKAYDTRERFEREEASRYRAISESAEHRKAKELIAGELQRRLEAGLTLPWTFKDESASDFHFEGDLLLGANQIATEYYQRTPFGSRFRLDIAVLGPPVQKAPMVLGGVEVELSHEFDGRKALIGRSLGFPLVSIDITGMSLDEITPAWARSALTATTRDHVQGRRRTFIYLHDLLYPLFIQIPRFIDREQRHQYLVFSDDETLQKLVVWFEGLGKALGYLTNVVSPHRINAKSEQSRKMLEAAGRVVGSDWQRFNASQCLRLTIPRPKSTSDLQSVRLHMTVSRLLLSHANALVGYKYCNGIHNNDSEDIWIHDHWEDRQRTQYRILPKRLAEPINYLIQVIGELDRDR